MKRVILCLSTLAVVAFAASRNTTYDYDDYYPEENEWESYQISVNWDEIEDTAESIAEKWQRYK